MGRPKETDTELPQRLRYSHGAYYYVSARRRGRRRPVAEWHWLSKVRVDAISIYERIEAGEIEMDLLPHLRKLKALDEIRLLPPAETVGGPGVYFLWRCGVLHYVGRSKSVSGRMRYHRLSGAKTAHESATALECDRFTSLLLEAVYISYYRPAGNEVV